MAQAISKADLFSRLAEGHAARTTVVTPNRRLSQGLMAEFDAHQAARGLAAWEAPDILPLEAFMVRLWEDAFYSERDLDRKSTRLLQSRLHLVCRLLLENKI